MAPYSSLPSAIPKTRLPKPMQLASITTVKSLAITGLSAATPDSYGLAAATAPSPILVATKLIRSLSTMPA
jgi:hypothetical protein